MTGWRLCESSGDGPGRREFQPFRRGRIPRPRRPLSQTGPERIGGGRRRYPELVFMEPEHDDREVYGDAWPLVEEWREIWKAGHRGAGKGLAWLRTEERVRTLEVAMLEEHGLTLPPGEDAALRPGPARPVGLAPEGPLAMPESHWYGRN